MSRAALCALGFGLIVAGCATQKVAPGPMTNVAADSFPAPDATPVANRQDYKIAAGDTINVTVFQLAELTRSGQVTGAGTFYMPPAGEVAVAGKTSEEASAAITAALSPRFVRDPHVNVEVKPANVPQFTVEGAVAQPGFYEADDDMTLLRAMAAAKGTPPGADVRQVVVFRVIGGVKYAQVFDLSDIRSARAVDPRIYANDLINVPVNSRYDTLRNVIGAVPLFALLR